jgi:hypothetical protein
VLTVIWPAHSPFQLVPCDSVNRNKLRLTESQGTNRIDAQQDATPKDKNHSPFVNPLRFFPSGFV